MLEIVKILETGKDLTEDDKIIYSKVVAIKADKSKYALSLSEGYRDYLLKKELLSNLVYRE